MWVLGPLGPYQGPRFPLKGPFKRDTETGIRIHIYIYVYRCRHVDIDSDLSASANRGVLLKEV